MTWPEFWKTLALVVPVSFATSIVTTLIYLRVSDWLEMRRMRIIAVFKGWQAPR